MGTHPIFESDFDCLTENLKKWHRTQLTTVAPATMATHWARCSACRVPSSLPRKCRAPPCTSWSASATTSWWARLSGSRVTRRRFPIGHFRLRLLPDWLQWPTHLTGLPIPKVDTNRVRLGRPLQVDLDWADN